MDAGGRFGAGGVRRGGSDDCCGERRSDGDRLWPRDAGESAGLVDCGGRRLGSGWGGGIVGDLADHFAFRHLEADAGGISGGDVKGAQDELGAAKVDGVADEGVDDLHERGLDGFLVLDEGDGVKA